MKILNFIFMPVFNFLIASYKKVCGIRKDDTPSQENVLFVMLMVIALMLVLGTVAICWYFSEPIIIPELVHK